MKRMNMRWIIGGAALAAALLLAPVSPAGVIYSQTFDTDTTDLLGTYTFSQSGLSAAAYTASGGQGLFTASGGYYMDLWTSNFSLAYDWSQPLTVSADIGSPNTGGGQSYGIALHSGTSPSGSSGLTYNLYWPSSGSHSWFSFSNSGGARIGINANPDATASDTTNYTIAMTVRETVGDSSRFDLKIEINGVAQTTPNGTWSAPDGYWPQGVTGDWIVGLSKSTWGVGGADPFNAIGVRADGLQGTSRLDNLSLTMIPEPASLGMLGAAVAAMLLRRKLRG